MIPSSATVPCRPSVGKVSTEAIKDAKHPTSVHPDNEFLATESTEEATGWVGSYRHNADFKLCLVPSGVEGNVFVYKSEAKNRPLHAYVLGQIVHSDHILSQTVTASSPHVNIERYALGVICGGSAKIRAQFAKDVGALNKIIRNECASEGQVHQRWVQRGVTDAEDAECIMVDGNSSVKIVNGPLEIGNIVLADVTLHRYDFRDGSLPFKSYTLVAHDIERISVKYLEREGMKADPSWEAAQDVLDQVTQALGNM
ncbi:hypothetical protein B0H13DRAFT_2320125 [Mycena leptocephala]|nr:hypothetical protein B0H13DRAFT_2331278 [Mycena leptocephala]KAJ7919834.1 hypothetical protein B0H13DRAFT_2320125 [Mycena leptocephala]